MMTRPRVVETPERRRAIALADFRHHLAEARQAAKKAHDEAVLVRVTMEDLLDALPDDATINGATEAELLAVTGGKLGPLLKAADHAEDSAINARGAFERLIGRLNEAETFHAGLSGAWDFSKTDND